MIDVESQIYTPIAQTLREQFPGIDVKGYPVAVPAAFPHASIVEMDNFTSQNRMDTGNGEKFATIMYQVDVYSNSGSPKSQARRILKVIDDRMYKLNFSRLSLNPVPNWADAGICRLTARYRAETDGIHIYRR